MLLLLYFFVRFNKTDMNMGIISSYLIYQLIYQLFWTQACLEGMCTNSTHGSHARCHPNPLPQPLKVGHTIGVYDPYSFRIVSDVGCFTSHKNKSVKVLWDGTYGFSSLSEKTRKSNHLQMSLQRQHFLLSYFKPWVLVRPGFEPATSRSADRCSLNWANQAAVCLVGKDVNKMWNDIYRAIAEVMTT